MSENKLTVNWLNNLRAIAVIAVIVLHASFEGFFNYGHFSMNKWLTATFFDSLSRFCVPVFLMITGALLLGRNESFILFYKKRLLRVILPFLFWSVIYFLINNLITSSEKIDTLFLTFLYCLKNGASFHFWYVYMLIGIYILIPILSKWVQGAKQNEILFFLILWGFIQMSFYPHFSIIRNVIDLRYLTGFIGFPVLGYYLSTIPIEKLLNKKVLIILIFIIGSLLNFGLTVINCIKSNAVIEFYLGYNTLNVVIQSIGLFLCVRILLQQKIKLLDLICKYSYGIYLAHVLVLQLLGRFSINVFYIHPLIGIIFTSTLCLLMSVLIIHLLSMLPLLKRVVT